MENKMLTAQEAAAKLRISKSKLYQLIRENAVPHIELGRRVLVPEGSLNSFIFEITHGGAR